MSILRPRQSPENLPTTERRIDPFALAMTPFSRAATAVMPILERIHDTEGIVKGEIPAGHELFPNGCAYEVAPFYDRIFSDVHGAGVWAVSIKTPDQDKLGKVGAFKSTALNQIGVFAEDIAARGLNGKDVIAWMVTTRGGTAVRDTREGVEAREAQVTAVLTAMAEQIVADPGHAQAVVAAGEAALYAA